jgi:hypothetical protein
MVGWKVLVAHDSQRYIISSENQSNEWIPGIRSITENGTCGAAIEEGVARISQSK